MTRQVTEPTIYCRKCGYVLDGLPDDTCPECGEVFDLLDPRTFRTSVGRPRLPIHWLLATLAYSILIAPVFIEQAVRNGARVSVLGELVPLLLNGFGIGIGIVWSRRQSMAEKTTTMILMFAAALVIAFVLVMLGTTELANFKRPLLGP